VRFTERLVRGDGDACFFLPLGQDLKQQLGAALWAGAASGRLLDRGVGGLLGHSVTGLGTHDLVPSVAWRGWRNSWS